MMDFIIQYWPYFVVAAAEMISLLVFIVIYRKRGISVDAIRLMVDEKIPYFINLAEASGVPGVEKLGFVVVACLKLIKKYVSSADEGYWISYIKERVETCLSTPQKKGAIYGKETQSK